MREPRDHALGDVATLLQVRDVRAELPNLRSQILGLATRRSPKALGQTPTGSGAGEELRGTDYHRCHHADLENYHYQDGEYFHSKLLRP